MKRTCIISLLVAVICWNPLLLILLTRSLGITCIVFVIALAFAYFVSLCQSLRLRVWAFNLCAIFSICLHSELLFREFCNNRITPNLYDLHYNYYFNKPFLDKMFRTNEYVSNYKTNCQGYRIDELSNPYDSIKTCDWLFIGDSFTQGAQVNYADLYSTQLYREFPDKVILNAGISGAGLYDELNYFKDKGKLLKPKYVFLQIGVFNDFFNIKERRSTYQDYLIAYSDLYRYFAYNVFSTDSLPLGRWTEPFFPSRQENTDYNILYKEVSPTKQADITAFKTCIKQWKIEVEKNGGKLFLLLLPSKEQVSTKLLMEVMHKYNISLSELDMDAPNKLFASTAESLNLDYLDLTEVFRESSSFPFFYQDEHLNVCGHNLIAKAMKEKLQGFYSDIKTTGTSNHHERYPSLYQRDSILLYQSMDSDGGYMITSASLKDGQKSVIVKSYEELIHPVYSKDRRYLAYTEGSQESSETDVILYDVIVGTSIKANQDNTYGAIPAFNHHCNLLAFPSWNKNKQDVANIVLYDIRKRAVIKRIHSEQECWRPIFALDDQSILYIQKDKHFIVRQYDISTSTTSTILAMPFDIWDITLSPSGTYLVFAGNKDGNWDLFSFSFKSRKVEQLTNTLGDEWDPAFGPTDNDLWFAGRFGFNDGVFYKQVDL